MATVPRIALSFARPLPSASRRLLPRSFHPARPLLRAPLQTRGKHRINNPPSSQPPQHSTTGSPVKTYFQDDSVHHPQVRVSDTRDEGVDDPSIPKIPFLLPAIWTLGASSAIYLLLALLAARSELEEEKQASSRQSFTRGLLGGAPSPTQNRFAPAIPGTELIGRVWSHSDSIMKLNVTIIATNCIVEFGSSSVMPLKYYLSHIPLRNNTWTLLTSTFAHTGRSHLAFNMISCLTLLPPAGTSPLFQGSACHMLSFFLATGTMTSCAQHLTKFWKRRTAAVLVGSCGASGALFGVFSTFCAQNPDAEMGIIFLPGFTIEAQKLLGAAMLFDLYGAVIGFGFVKLAHASHLAGAVLGLGYTYLDGRKNLWDPLKNFWKRRLQPKS